MSNTPQIRFAGFTDDWEQRKFSDFTFPAGERNKDDLDLEPFAITNNQGFIAQSEAHDDFGYMKDVDRKMYIVVKPNSFAYNPARINVGSLGYYEGAENVIVSSLYEVFQTAEYVDDKFLKHWFKTKAFQDWIERLQEGSVRLYFYYDKLCECILSMPSVQEQRKIGAYLDKIDTLITLHQRKCDALQKFKKSMLQKMFPQNGESVPEIRFAGFTDAWEQRKVKDIAENTYGGGTPQTSIDRYWNGEIPWIQSQDIIENQLFYVEPRKHISEEAISKSATKLVPKNSIAIVTRVGVGKLAFMPFSYCTSQDFLSLSGIKIDEKYATYSIYQMLQKEKQNVQGTSIKGITIEEMLSKKIEVPCNSAEQEAIGAFFHNLDTLITLHQRKLETLQKMKKALLQKMFV